MPPPDPRPPRSNPPPAPAPVPAPAPAPAPAAPTADTPVIATNGEGVAAIAAAPTADALLSGLGQAIAREVVAAQTKDSGNHGPDWLKLIGGLSGMASALKAGDWQDAATGLIVITDAIARPLTVDDREKLASALSDALKLAVLSDPTPAGNPSPPKVK